MSLVTFQTIQKFREAARDTVKHHILRVGNLV